MTPAKLRYGSANYRNLLPILEKVDSGENRYHKFTSAPYTPLSVEYLYNDWKGRPVYAMAHNTVINGDLCCDPDMTFAVDHDSQTVEPFTYQNDFFPIYQRVYTTDENGTRLFSPRLRKELDSFLHDWLKNIQEQGFLDN